MFILILAIFPPLTEVCVKWWWCTCTRARAHVWREREIRKIYSFKPLHLMKGSLKLERQTDRDRKTDSQADRYRDRQTEKIWIRQIYSFRSLHLMKECLQLMREREREREGERERGREKEQVHNQVCGGSLLQQVFFSDPAFRFSMQADCGST